MNSPSCPVSPCASSQSNLDSFMASLLSRNHQQLLLSTSGSRDLQKIMSPLSLPCFPNHTIELVVDQATSPAKRSTHRSRSGRETPKSRGVSRWNSSEEKQLFGASPTLPKPPTRRCSLTSCQSATQRESKAAENEFCHQSCSTEAPRKPRRSTESVRRTQAA